MLTAELVLARRRGGELLLAGLSGEARERAVLLARELVDLHRASVGLSRDDLEAALAAVLVAPRDEKVKAGLSKLLEDRSTFALADELDPEGVRRELFTRAARERRAAPDGERLDRARVLSEVARELGREPAVLERALFGDLRGAGVLTSVEPISADALVELYERSQAQAVLLRAVRVKIALSSATAASARAIFRRLKFLGLLHTIEPAPAGYQITIDGPLSLFESVTRYGQRMALVLPLLDGCEAWSLEADIRWGKDRVPLLYRASGGAQSAEAGEPALSDELSALVKAFHGHESGWRARACQTVLEVPGLGLFVPDLVFTRRGASVFFEVLGFWSRDAVFRRVDLVERGLGSPAVFAVSSRLRVSEELLGEDAPGALYVYKGVMSPRAIAERLDRAARPSPRAR